MIDILIKRFYLSLYSDLFNFMKQEKLIRHQTSLLPECGYVVRIIDTEKESVQPVRYSHRDDYYIMGIIVSGKLTCHIDFQRFIIEDNSIFILTPGQVHQFVLENDIVAVILAVEPRLLDEHTRGRLNRQQTFHSPVYHTDNYSDLITLCKLIQRQNNISVGVNMVKAAVEIIVDKATAQNSEQILKTHRKRELMFMFRKLLNENITTERRPGFYAEQLNISTVYLNEITNSVTGLSASEYIKNEIILLAKRELYYTSDSIKEISARLGFSDNAYFSRLFTETVGVSPNVFRRNLDKSN